MKLCPQCSEPFAPDAGFCPFDGAALVKSADPLLGRTLASRYRLVRPVGEGGMAVVYLARHVMIERLSAIKILRRDLGLSPLHRERFLREARAVNRINHPNIVEITDFGESDGLVFLVMEYVEGFSLLEMLRRMRFPWVRAARVGIQIASALGRAHEMGVIHRDLKPENVLLTERLGEDFVKLTDFGIAKIVDAPTIAFAQQNFGTPGYIPPEYIEGAPAGKRGDLYGFGVVLYEMLTGKLPFDVRGAELFAAALHQAPVKPSSRVPGIPAELEELVLCCIARRPEDRPTDAFAVHDALTDIVRRMGSGSMRPPAVSEAPFDARDAIPTALDEVYDVVISTRSQNTAELTTPPTAEIAARWHGMLSDLEAQVEAAHRAGGEPPVIVRARELAEHAKVLVVSLERAKGTAAEHQAHVDRLEAHARSFRTVLGHAIDTLSRDRSREAAHLHAVAARRTKLDETSTVSALDTRGKDSLLWEMAALGAEESKAHALDQDLSFQIEALQQQLDARNEQLDNELSQAKGALEGALTAIRRMTGELVKTIEEAASAVG